MSSSHTCSQDGMGSLCDLYLWCHWSVTGDMGSPASSLLSTWDPQPKPCPPPPLQTWRNMFNLFNLDIIIQGTPPGMFSSNAGGTHATGMLSCYRLQRSWGKVIFSVAYVKNSVPSTPPPGQVHPLGRYPPLRAGTPLGQVQPPRQVHPPGQIHPHGQWAGGTHPTGMHSCLVIVYRIYSVKTSYWPSETYSRSP